MSKRLNDGDGSRTNEQASKNIYDSTKRERIFMREIMPNEIREKHPKKKFEIVSLGVGGRGEDGTLFDDNEAMEIGSDMGAADYALTVDDKLFIVEVMAHTLSSPTFSIKEDKCHRMIEQKAQILIPTESFYYWLKPSVLEEMMSKYMCREVMGSGKPGIRLTGLDVYNEIKGGNIQEVKWLKSSRDLLEPLRDVLFIRRKKNGELKEWNTPQRRETAWNMWSLWK